MVWLYAARGLNRQKTSADDRAITLRRYTMPGQQNNVCSYFRRKWHSDHRHESARAELLRHSTRRRKKTAKPPTLYDPRHDYCPHYRSELAHDVHGVLEKVQQGVEVIVEQNHRPVAVIKASKPAGR